MVRVRVTSLADAQAWLVWRNFGKIKSRFGQLTDRRLECVADGWRLAGDAIPASLAKNLLWLSRPQQYNWADCEEAVRLLEEEAQG